MSNQHTENHNEAFALVNALQRNHDVHTLVEHRNAAIDNLALTRIPWKQYHRANVPHLGRHSS